MAANEGIRSPFPTQPPARSPKFRIYESLFLFNEGVDYLVALLHSMQALPFAEKEELRSAIVEIEEVRCDMNADFTEQLADSERFDEGQFWKQQRAFEKEWRDPDDVYIDVERREEERKKQGLPPRVIGTILPHSSVAAAEERWEAEREHKKKRSRKRRKPTPKAKNSRREKLMTKKRGRKKPKIVFVGSTPVTRITPEERKKLHKLMKERLAMRRKKYPEVRGKGCGLHHSFR